MTYCTIHDREEPSRPGDRVYVICFECGHVYGGWDDLITEVVLAGFPLHNEGVRFCPLCLEDFPVLVKPPGQRSVQSYTSPGWQTGRS